MLLKNSIADIISGASTEDSRDICPLLLSTMKERMGASTLAFMTSDRGELQRRFSIGFEHDGEECAAHAKIANAVYSSGKRLSSTGEEMMIGTLTTRYVAYPLMMGTKVIGVVSVSRGSEGFTEDEIEDGKLFCVLVALMLERTRLYLEKHVNENLQVIGMLKSSVAHDISNMLGVVRVYIELMESEAEQGSIFADYLEAIKGEISRIASLAADMLDLSKKHVRLNKAPFSVTDFIVDFQRHNKVLIKDTGIDIIYKVDGDITINADQVRLFRVFSNIIKNAVEALQHNGKIVFKVKRIKDWAYFLVMDNGKGISADNIKVLFNPFFTSGKSNGTGLGLAVVKDMVYAHGGTVKVRSQEGRYTCFVIRIPVNG